MHLTSILLIACLFLSHISIGQTIEFSDDFESGAAAWVLTGPFGISTVFAYGGTNSLSESPVGNYPDASVYSATMASGVDLTSALDANLTFWAIYDIEAGFDYMYVDASPDGGGSWVNLDAFDGEGLLSPWVQYTYSLGGFVGNSDVRLRFRFESDGAVNYDGMYIDDLEITSSNSDMAPPLLLHTPPELYEGSLGDFPLEASLIDISGIASTEVFYTVDGGATLSVSGVPVSGDDWSYTVPEQTPGSWVNYWIQATDGAVAANMVTSDTFSYIAGNYIVYDNANIDFVNSFGPAALGGIGCAVRISLSGTSDLVTAIIRNYTDPGRINSPMEVHIWEDLGGAPGADLITPVLTTPEATISEPNTPTRIDLRPFSADLSGLSGDIWIGFTVPSGETWVSQTTPGIGGRTSIFDGSTWLAITDDYHFRAITTAPLGAPEADYTVDASADPLIAFTDISTNSPTNWAWTFGDGGTSIDADPTHSYLANGTYNVCLTATNAVGGDTECKTVVVSGVVIAPVAAFSFDTSANPIVSFTDMSTNTPDTWWWDLGDGNISSDQDPVHTYAAPGSYEVCLVASNSGGSSDTSCQTVVLLEEPSGIFSPQESAFQIYPNPGRDNVTLIFEMELSGSALLDITDISGRNIASYTLSSGVVTHTIDVRKFDPGMYFIRITDKHQNTITSNLQIIR